MSTAKAKESARLTLKADLDVCYSSLTNMARLLKSQADSDPSGVALAVAAALLKARVQVEQGIEKLVGDR